MKHTLTTVRTRKDIKGRKGRKDGNIAFDIQHTLWTVRTRKDIKGRKVRRKDVKNTSFVYI